MPLNLCAGWIGILLGCFAGAVQGLRFDGEGWLGGYASWPRRMLRLGHISFFGLGILNLAYTQAAAWLSPAPVWPSRLLVAGAVTMPAVCYLAAFHKPYRRLFFIPALSVILGVAILVWRIVLP